MSNKNFVLVRSSFYESSNDVHCKSFPLLVTYTCDLNNKTVENVLKEYYDNCLSHLCTFAVVYTFDTRGHL